MSAFYLIITNLNITLTIINDVVKTKYMKNLIFFQYFPDDLNLIFSMSEE